MAERIGTDRPTRSAWLLALCWLAFFGTLQWSVVRYRDPIVLTLTLVAAALAWWQVGQRDVRMPRAAAAAVLLGSVVSLWAVPLFSYVPPGWLLGARLVLTATALTAAVLLLRGGTRGAHAAYGSAVLGHVLTATFVVLGDRAPRIDVWVTLQQSADALGRGENMYAMAFPGSPGVRDMFTYLPWSCVLLAPGRWLAADVRWALLGWFVVLLLGLWRLAGGGARAGVVAALLVLAPGSITQVDQAWTEPLLAALLVWWAVLVREDRSWWAVVPLGLACASKQHMLVLLPLLMLWRPFGWRRTVASGGLAAALVAPWVIASPRDFVHDTLTSLVGFPPLRFANTWYLLWMHRGVTLPFWVTGALVLATLALMGWMIHRRQPSLPEMLRWCALILLVANLVNKQAFYNQFWLSGALVAASVAVGPALSRRRARAAVGASPG